MDCSVVIPCHNGAELTRACLESLLDQQGDHQLEILLVDNGSSDDTAALADLAPCIRLLSQGRNLGFAAGVNQGLRAASHPLILVLNNDTQAAANMLSALHSALMTDERIGAVAPVSNFVKGPARLDLGAATRNRELRETVAAELGMAPGPLHDVETLAGLCLLLRRAALDETGLFDERFGHGNFEDDDLCLRLRLQGYRLVIARRAFLHHEGHATFRTMGLDVPREMDRRFRQFAAKWQQDPAGRAALASAGNQLLLAEQEARAARGRWPRWLDADWHQARARLLAGEPASAANHLRAFLARCPCHTDAAIELALAWLALGDVAGAQQQLQWVADNLHVTEENQASLCRRLGQHWLENGQWSAAARSFRDALELQPEEARLHNWLGACLLELDRPVEAEAAFATAAAKGFPLAFTNLGICAHRRGDLAAAERHFATACELLPDDALVRANLAAVRQLSAPAGR